MTVSQLIAQLRRYDFRAEVELHIVTEDGEALTQVGSVSEARDSRNRVIVQISNEGK